MTYFLVQVQQAGESSVLLQQDAPQVEASDVEYDITDESPPERRVISVHQPVSTQHPWWRLQGNETRQRIIGKFSAFSYLFQYLLILLDINNYVLFRANVGKCNIRNPGFYEKTVPSLTVI